MNRRGFLQRLVLGAAAFTVLPAATTYQRVWKSVAPPEVLVACLNPEWVNAPYEMRFFSYVDLLEPHQWPAKMGELVDRGRQNKSLTGTAVPYPARYRDARARPEDLIPPFIWCPKKSC